MFILGVTGGIGSGKSTVCNIFNVLGVPVFSSDIEAKILMEENSDLRKEINVLTGTDMYTAGKLDRVRMADLIFNDEKLLSRINGIVHPVVFDHFSNWVSRQTSSYVIMEAAILFESGADSLTSKVLAVTAPFEERIFRVMNRNNLTREKVLERIKHQISEGEMANRSDFIVNNADDMMIIPQVITIHNTIINFNKES